MSDFKIHEVGLRDGLQMEQKVVPFNLKLKWAESLINSGLDIVQLGSFVHPVKVPQMADTDKLFNFFKDREHNAILSGLILNERGMERALDCGVEMFCLGVSASNTHSKKNTGMSTDEAQSRIIAIAKDLTDMKKNVQVSVQSAFGCGFEGNIEKEKVYSIIDKYIENGLYNISLADTAGHSYPEQVEEMTDYIKSKNSKIQLAVHIHNTYGLGMVNTYMAIKNGADIIETAFGGLGGCPFTKQAAGNVCTEDLLHGISRHKNIGKIKLNNIIEIAKNAASFFERELPGHIYKSGTINY
jgi:hydroxymethylglutaryl-CoA lyase